MESDLIIEQEHRRNLIRYYLRRMIMSVVHQTDDTVPGGIIHCEFAGTNGVGFQADAEHFGLQANQDLGPVIIDG